MTAEAGGPGTDPPRRRRFRVRSRLLAMIAVPTVVAVALGVVALAGALGTAAGYGRAATLADVAREVTRTVADLESEQSAAAVLVAAGRADPAREQLTAAQARTDRDTAALRRVAADVGDDHAPATRDRLRRALFRLDTLPALRAGVTGSAEPAGVVVDRYARVVTDLLAVDDEVAQAGADATLGASVRALGALSRVGAEVAVQRASLAAAFTARGFDPGGLETLTEAGAAREGAETQFRTAATAQQAQTYDDVVAGADVDQAAAVLDGVTASGGAVVVGGGPAAGAAWDAAAAGTLAKVHAVEAGLVDAVDARAGELRSAQITRAVVFGVVALAVLLVALLATVLVARSLVRPLRALRRGALAVAGDRLPALVGRLDRADPDTVDLRVDPVDVRDGDEIGEVARSFDEVHREAVRLAAAEARRRAQTGALFVNLSRRTQSLVDRQLELIDDLERSEEDPDRLGELFRLDHLATRMRRNGENLLVLGGEEPLRRWPRVMPLFDVLRAAASEVEQYARVRVDRVPDAVVTEEAVSDVVHLLAELMDNATSFSGRGAPVTVECIALPEGAVLVEIADRGIGLDAEQVSTLNARLAGGADDRPVGEVSRRMGLVVVARLAARRGAGVRLRPDDHGVTAQVTLPGTLLAPQRAEAAPAPGDAAPDGSGGPGGDGAWIGERWSRAVATPGPGADSWFGGAPLPAGSSPPTAAAPTGRHHADTSAAPRPSPLAPVAAAFTPSADGTTAAGLPRRAPGANHVPGSEGGGPDDAARPAAGPAPGTASGTATGTATGTAPRWDRSAGAVRARWAGVQHGRARGMVERGTAGVAAERVRSPLARGTTGTGLPRREPGANHVPGAAEEPDVGGAAWDRSPEAVRARWGAGQHGRRRARENGR